MLLPDGVMAWFPKDYLFIDADEEDMGILDTEEDSDGKNE